MDVWSLGIVLFAMLAGYLPFHAKEKKQLSEKILAGGWRCGGGKWLGVRGCAGQPLLMLLPSGHPMAGMCCEAHWSLKPAVVRLWRFPCCNRCLTPPAPPLPTSRRVQASGVDELGGPGPAVPHAVPGP